MWQAVARAALREDPDVLVIESMRTAPLINVALEAAASGQLVIGGFPAHNTTAAIDRIIDLYPPEYRRQVQLALAENLRGVVAQVLLRRPAAGGWPAREILLNTPAVASIIAEGKDVTVAAGDRRRPPAGHGAAQRRAGGFVQSGAVDVREAYRRAADRRGFSRCSSGWASTRRRSSAAAMQPALTQVESEPDVRLARLSLDERLQFVQHKSSTSSSVSARCRSVAIQTSSV